MGSLYGAELAAPQEAGSNPQRFATGSGRTLGQAGEYATAPRACEHCFWLLASSRWHYDKRWQKYRKVTKKKQKVSLVRIARQAMAVWRHSVEILISEDMPRQQLREQLVPLPQWRCIWDLSQASSSAYLGWGQLSLAVELGPGDCANPIDRSTARPGALIVLGGLDHQCGGLCSTLRLEVSAFTSNWIYSWGQILMNARCGFSIFCGTANTDQEWSKHPSLPDRPIPDMSALSAMTEVCALALRSLVQSFTTALFRDTCNQSGDTLDMETNEYCSRSSARLQLLSRNILRIFVFIFHVCDITKLSNRGQCLPMHFSIS